MKNRSKILLQLGILGWVVGSCGLVQANTTYSADYYLTTPDAFVGQMVTLDVMGVRPVNFKSPVPDLAFFHMHTWDRTKNIHGGEIMLVAPAADSRAIMKKYGGKGPHPGMSTAEVEKMKGIFTLSPGKPRGEWREKGEGDNAVRKPEPAGGDTAVKPAGATDKPEGEKEGGPKGPRPGFMHGPEHPRMWMIDYEGKSRAIMEAHKEELKNLQKNQEEEGPSAGKQKQ